MPFRHAIPPIEKNDEKAYILGLAFSRNRSQYFKQHAAPLFKASSAPKLPAPTITVSHRDGAHGRGALPMKVVTPSFFRHGSLICGRWLVWRVDGWRALSHHCLP